MRLVLLSAIMPLLILLSACSQPSQLAHPNSRFGSTMTVELDPPENENQPKSHDPLVYCESVSWLSIATQSTIEFAKEYTTFLEFPAPAREGFRLLAENEMEPYQLLLNDMVTLKEREEQNFMFQNEARSVFMQRGRGFNDALVALRKATDIDPSYIAAWSAKGELAFKAGALHNARKSLEAAMLISEERVAAGDNLDLEQRLVIYRNLGWVLRELGYYSEGLVHVERGLLLARKDYELSLVRGLLLAGAGRTTEAINAAVALPPIQVQVLDSTRVGLSHRNSGYPSLWIKSQALGAEGDWEAAWHLLKDVLLHQRQLPFGGQFWSDVGMAAELSGQEDASVYYGIGFINIRYRLFCPVMPNAMGSMVLDIPNPRTPVYTGFGTRFYISGSRLTYAVLKMNELAGSVFPKQRTAAAEAALDAVDIAERRHFRPVICHALRGRIYYEMARYEEAEAELNLARKGLATQDKIDEYTSFRLGLLALKDGRNEEAQALAEEALSKDLEVAAFWRSLAVAQAAQDKTEEAEASFDKALHLDPLSLPGLFNAGLLYCKLQRFEEAVSVLEKAYLLDPENREVQHLLHMAAGSSRLQGKQVQSAKAKDIENAPDISTAYVNQIMEELSAVFSVGGVPEGAIRPDSSLALARYIYQKEPTHFNRKVLALALQDAGRSVEMQSLLKPFWGDSLDPDEVVMLLFIDRQEGTLGRAQSLARSMLDGETGTDNPYIWVLALSSLSNDGGQNAQQALSHMATNPDLGLNGKTGAGARNYWRTFLQSGFANYRLALQQEYAEPEDNKW